MKMGQVSKLLCETSIAFCGMKMGQVPAESYIAIIIPRLLAMTPKDC